MKCAMSTMKNIAAAAMTLAVVFGFAGSVALSGFGGSGQGYFHLYQFAGRFGICRSGYL